MTYNIGDKVVHANGGVFIICDTKIMNYGSGDVKYYCLKPYFNNDKDNMVLYVPENKNDELIRPLMSKDEAEGVISTMDSISPIWYDDIKERKVRFGELISTGKIVNICKVLKSLYIQQVKLMKDNKSLNLIDYECLNKLKKGVEEELSVSLDVSIECIENRVFKYSELPTT